MIIITFTVLFMSFKTIAVPAVAISRVELQKSPFE